MNFTLRIILASLLYALFLTACNKTGSPEPVNLQCEYLVNPLGTDIRRPRFTWQMTGDRQGASWKAFRVFVGTDSADVAKGTANIWKSGKVNSNLIPFVYGGPELESFTRYYWSVQILDERGNWSGISKPAFFETAMMKLSDWKGKWITDTHNIHLKPAPYFRKSFKAGKEVEQARAYIAVAGLYELFINGEKVGDHRLDPMYTRFDRRTLYVTFDVTGHLRQGDNVIGVLLGNGWYNHQSTAVWYFDMAPWRARPKFCMDLHVTYSDGTREVIVSDQNWKSALSPVVSNNIYTAEHYDARLEQPGWNKPGFDDSKWKPVLLMGAPSPLMKAQLLHPVRNVEKIAAVEMKQLDARTFVYDFGRNISGVSCLETEGAEGTTIRLKHAEILDKEGRADLSKIEVHYRPVDDSDPFQTDIFILGGKGRESFMPHFNYKGFQYVEVTSDKPVHLTKESLTAYFMHSDVPPAGSIRSSNPVLDKIWQAGNASYLSNLFGYPTDCPQREKNGWTGDAHISIETALYNFSGITVYEKWMADHQDEQQPNGILPAIIPSSGWGYHWANGLDWTSTIAIIPWNIYLFYGDSRLLESCYGNIKSYVDYVSSISPDGLTDWGLGDWVPVKSKASRELTSSLYYYTDAVILSKAAQLFGKPDDNVKYSALAEKIKNAINEKYLNRETGIYGQGVQTEMSAPLKWGVVPEEMVEKVAANLAKRVNDDNDHIDVGLLGSKTILNALSENGYADLACKVALQETYPSWGWWIVNGATSMYEHWVVGSSRDASRNHIMFGEISAWFYKALGGIFPDEKAPGFKNIILKPHFAAGLDHFEASHQGPYGTIVSSWKKQDGKVMYDVAIPPNSSATLYLNARNILEGGKEISKNKSVRVVQKEKHPGIYYLESGKYSFTIEM